MPERLEALGFPVAKLLHYNPLMKTGSALLIFVCAIASASLPPLRAQKIPSPPPPSAARVLLLPRRIVSGERATLAVLDLNGRLTPGVTVNFSNGDRVQTDATGRALFVAPLNPGVIIGSIERRTGRVATTVLAPAEASLASATEISAAPRLASLTDRFELLGKGFCGDADANQVKVAGRPALVLASSPVAVVILPPGELEPGDANVEIACAKRQARPFSLTFVELTLQADSSPLKPGEHRILTVRIRGTTAKVPLEARNLAPEVAELEESNPAKTFSNGGKENVARYEVVGRKNGSFRISIRLVPTLARPR